MKKEIQKVIKNNDLNSYTKTKLVEEMEKTNKLIAKVEKSIERSIANHEEELNKRNVKVLELKNLLKQLDELQKQVF